MNLKNLLPAAIAGIIGISTPACKPLAEKKKAEVENILRIVQPTEDVVASSREYYGNREDLVNISDDERVSLTLGHAKLTRVAQALKDGSLSFEHFYNHIVQSQERIITDKNTKLQTDFAGYHRGASVTSKTIEFWTDPGFSNTIMEDYAVSQVELKGGELTVVISGNTYETVATGEAEKQQIDANLGPKDGKRPESKTLTLRLVLK